MAARKGVTFVLERFGWSAPDRIELVARWSGLRRHGRAPLTLVLRAGDRTHRLPALGDGAAQSDPSRLRLAFAWDGERVAIEDAHLEVGPDFVVPLAPPRRGRSRFRAPGAATEEREHTLGLGETLRLQEALIAARGLAEALEEALEEAREATERAEHEADRARERRRVESERLRAELASVRAAADAAVAHERRLAHGSDAEQADLRRRLEEAEATVERLGAKLAAARARGGMR